MLSRFSYGPTPGQVEAVVHQGLDQWLEAQLNLQDQDSTCQQALQAYPALSMDLKTMDKTYLAAPQLKKMATAAGVGVKNPNAGEGEAAKDRRALQDFVRQNGTCSAN